MKICIVQCPSNSNLNENLNTAKSVLINASKKQCDLVVFPELYLSGYLLDKNIRTNAVDLKHYAIKSLQEICRQHNIACVIGFPRKNSCDLFNSSCFIDKDGKIVGVYDKTHLFGDEKLYFTAGQVLKTFETSLGKVGLLICYDIEFPEPSRTLALQGADMIVCISANMKPYYNLHKKFIEIRALENTIPIIYCNYIGKNQQFSFVGKSNIINNKGKNICRYSKNKKLICGNLLKEAIDDRNIIYVNNLRPELYR